MKQELPPYFREYLDEKFDHAVDQVNSVKDEVKGVKLEMRKMNGSIKANTTKIEENRKVIQDNTNEMTSYKNKIIKMGIVSVAVLAIWIEEFRMIFMKIVSGFF